MDKLMAIAGVLLTLAGLTGIVYGVGINVQTMLARRATDYSFITAYITEWALVLLAGLSLIIGGARRK
jgi:hypothetical protein